MCKATLRERFLSKCVATETGCWEWTGGHFVSTGYASFNLKRDDGIWRPQPAHRVAYELLHGSIPEGLEIDHLCRNRGCVNPGHLEAVTRRENIRRSFGPSGINARKTHCSKGHPYDAENTRVRRGKRECIECYRAMDRARQKTEKRRVAQRARYWRQKTASD